jgi:tetratricopeptide (TPR) repeat protein
MEAGIPVRTSVIKQTVLILSAVICLLAQTATAETKNFIREYTYQAGENDSKLSCRTIALEQVKRLLLEELGVYLESRTEIKNFQLTRDQVTMLASGIVQTEIISEKWDTETLKYRIRAKISADPEEVVKSLGELRKDARRVKELEETREKAEKALKEIESLKKDLNQEKKEKITEYNNAVKRLSAEEWFQKGMASWTDQRYQDAADAYTKTIELDPTNVLAIDNRGACYGKLGKYREAMADHNRAIDLNPRYAPAYTNRGAIYFFIGNYEKSAENHSKAIELDSGNHLAWGNRGAVFVALGRYRDGVSDLNKAIELAPDFSDHYMNRAAAFLYLDQNREALKDLNRAIELDPFNHRAYNNRSVAYYRLGEHEKSHADLKTAAKLGNPDSQNALRKAGETW